MKNNKGITLIALVVTIIVLLILAGVSIAMLTGQNGILTKSSEASVESAVAGAKEKVALAVNEGITDYYKDTYGASTTQANLYEKVKATVVELNSKEENGATITAAEATTESEPATKQVNISITYKGTVKATGKVSSDGVLTWDASPATK